MRNHAFQFLSVLVVLMCTSPGWGDLIHHFEFEEGFEDSVGDLEGLAIGGAAITDDAKVGDGALDVGGGGDYVEFPDSETLQFSQFDSYTVTAWVRTAASSGWRGVVTKGRESPPWYGIWINPGNRWVFGTPPNNLAGSAVQFNIWVHTAVVQDGDLGTRDLYVDGELVASNTARDAVNFAPVIIGGAGGVSEWFRGQIDEVRIYDEPLGEDGVLESMGLEPDDCADGPDTHCQGLTVTDRDGSAVGAGTSHPSGALTVEVDALDDGGDAIRYELSADNGVDPPIEIASLTPSFTVGLGPGTWTISVTVDDKASCEDVADDATCTTGPFTVEPGEVELIHRWDFEDDFIDSVGEADGTPMGNAALIGDAMIGEQALEVTGSGDHMLVAEPDDGSLRFTAVEDYSVTAWIRPQASGGWRGVVNKGRENAPWYGIWINPNDQWVYGTQPNNLAGPTIEFDVWTHVAVVQNGGVGTRELWVNGVLEANNTARDASSESPLYIGGAGGVNEWFVGQIDDVRVYLGALDEEGVEMSMEAPDAPAGPMYVRGDTNADDSLNITDGVFILNFLFGGEGDPPCLAALDANHDGSRNVTDAVFILNFLFGGGANAPPAPFPDCGLDPEPDTVECASFPPCQ